MTSRIMTICKIADDLVEDLSWEAVKEGLGLILLFASIQIIILAAFG